MTTLTVLLLSLIAGGVVNRFVDAVPRQSTAKAVGGAACRPWRTGLIYLSTAALGGLAQIQWGWTAQALLSALEAWFFLAILIIDLEHHLVLNRMIGPALPLFFGANLLIGTQPVHALILGGLAGFGIFLLIALVVPGAMGMGDVKLAGLIGATVGLSGVLMALYSGILLGGIAAIVLLLKHRCRPGLRMAYAPYLVLGTWFVLFKGTDLLTLPLFQP